MLDKLSNVLKKTTDKIANALFLDRNLVDLVLRDLQRALLEADVNVHLVLDITKKVREAAFDERIKGIEKKEHIIKLLYDELVSILGKKKEIKLNEERNVFLITGLYGSGKTTTVAKLCSYYAKRGFKTCAVGLDVHRPAASEQLRQLCQKLNVPVFVQQDEKNPESIWKKYKKEIEKYQLVVVDTAGRDSLDDELIDELKKISDMVSPTEVFLVLSADIGQTAKKQAEAFNRAAPVSGIIITKMDSTAKGGGALTACAEIGASVVFIGTGEKPADIETFNPESFLSRLLGMGDLQTLMEKIHSVMDKDKIKEQQKKISEGKFNLKDLQLQLESMEAIGSFDKILSFIPGLSKAKVPNDALESQQERVKKWKYAIDSMTKEEIENPEIIEKETTRLQRIAKGSGVYTSDIRMLIKQYRLLKEFATSGEQLSDSGSLDQRTMMKLAKKFGRRLRF